MWQKGNAGEVPIEIALRWRNVSVKASQITVNWTVYLAVCWEQKEHQSSALLTLCETSPPMTGTWIPAQRACHDVFMYD